MSTQHVVHRILEPGLPGDGFTPSEAAHVRAGVDRVDPGGTGAPGSVIMQTATGPVWQPKATVDVRDYVDDIAELAVDADPAILAAHADLMSQGGGTMLFGQATYLRGSSNLTLITDYPLTIDLNGQTIHQVRPGANSLHGWNVRPSRNTGLTISANISRGATSATLTDASGIQPGDVLQFNGNDIVETGWSMRRLAAMLVETVNGNVVTFTSDFRLPFPTTDCTITQYIQPPPVTIKNGTLRFAAVPYASEEPELIQFLGFRSPRGESIRIECPAPYTAGRGGEGVGLRFTHCVGTQVNNYSAEGVCYGTIVSNCLNSQFSNVYGTRTRHPVAVTGWSVNTTISNLSGDRNQSSLEAHPSFDTHYINVRAKREEYYPMLRCVGGSVTDAKIHCDATDASPRSTMHNVAFVSAVLNAEVAYADAWLKMTDVDIITPNMTNSSAISAMRGNVVLTNVNANVRRAAAQATAWDYRLASITMTNCRNNDGTPWARDNFDTPPRVVDQPVLHGTNIGGTIHINPYKNVVDSSRDMMRCYGKIFQGVSAAGSFTTTIRLHTNAWNIIGVGYINYIHGVLRLRGTVRHSNAGIGDILTKDYHFIFNATGAGAVEFPSAPAREDAPTGHSSESLVLNISNPTSSGAANGVDTWVQIDVTMSSGRTNPLYGLTYELELIKAV